MDRDRLPHLLNISYVVNEAKDNPSKEFPTLNGNGIGHEALNPASYMLMIMTTMTMMMMMMT
jgi:hypothetical protein